MRLVLEHMHMQLCVHTEAVTLVIEARTLTTKTAFFKEDTMCTELTKVL